MKSNWFEGLILTMACFLALLSCEEQMPDSNNGTDLEGIGIENEEFLNHYVIFDLILNDLEVLTFDAISDLNDRDPSGSAFTHIDSYLFFGRGSCAVITNDFDLNLITIDFGNGCIDSKGIFRQGKIEIAYDYADNRVGNTLQVLLTNYRFQGQAFIGEFTITRQPNTDFNDVYQVSFNSVELTIADNSLILSGLMNQRHNQQDAYEEMLIEKNSTGTFNGNIAISSNTSITKRYSSDCFNEDIYMANIGVEDILLNGTSFQLNFSQEISSGQVVSTCDYIISLSDSQEKKSQIDLRSFLSQ